MSNTLYDKGRAAFGNGQIPWLSGNIKAILVDSALYTEDLVNDEFLQDVPVGARTSISANLTGKNNTGGIMGAADTPFTAVPAGLPQEYVVLFLDLGGESTSRLIGRVDTATGLPITPNGGDITVVWPTTGDKIFKL